MAKSTKISWAGSTLNVGIGCEHVSEGCDHCYADELVSRYAGQKGWPRTFESGIWKPEKLADIEKWAKQGGRRIFVNSLSDVHWRQWSNDQVTQLYDAMLAQPVHDYLVLTKRPQRMRDFFLGNPMHTGWLERRGLEEVPPWIWLGTSIESPRFTWRTNWLAQIPATVRFVSAEPLLDRIVLDLDGISWVIVGGESGLTRRPFDLAWAEDLRDDCDNQGVAFFFKQDAGRRSGERPDALGRLFEEYPLEHPAFRSGPRVLGRFEDPSSETTVVIHPPNQELLL